MSVAKRLPGAALSKRTVDLVETLEGKNVEAFEIALEAAVKESGLRLKTLDKKSERALLHAHKKVLISQVEEENDPVALLPRVVALLFVQVHSRALEAPGRAMAAAVSRLKNGLSEDLYTTLMAYHTSTVQRLSLQSTSLPGDNDCSNDRLRTKREALIQLMPSMKSLAVANSAVTKA